MAKRTADDREDAPLKGGERPEQMDVDMDKDMGEFEDEFESEDEIIEAGVDGRPDAEREAEEKERECPADRRAIQRETDRGLLQQRPWRSTKEPSSSDEAS